MYINLFGILTKSKSFGTLFVLDYGAKKFQKFDFPAPTPALYTTHIHAPVLAPAPTPAPKVAQVIAKLEKKKQEAVATERFEYAKKIKSAIGELEDSVLED